MKPIHVQLADEGGDVGVLEVRAATVSETSGSRYERNSREDFGEFGGRRHHETVVGAGPGDEMLDAGVL